MNRATKLRTFVLALAIVCTGPSISIAQDKLPPAPFAYRQIDDPAKEAQALALMHSLRCLVCDGQSIADSDAPMAGDMRSLVRIRIAKGESPDAVRQWLIERYGAMISYDPPAKGMGLILWLMPLLLVGLAGFMLFRRIKTQPGKQEG
jgi:cytochrome c-type biogenesis protein CcmH